MKDQRTKEEVDKLMEECEASGMSVAQFAKSKGVSASTIYSITNRRRTESKAAQSKKKRGGKVKQYSPEEKRTVFDLLKKGLTVEQVSNRTNTPCGTITTWLHRAKPDKPVRRSTPKVSKLTGGDDLGRATLILETIKALRKEIKSLKHELTEEVEQL